MKAPLISVGAAFLLLACAGPRGAGEPPPGPDPDAFAQMRDVEGNEVGTVTYTRWNAGVRVEVELSGLDIGPGFRGFHLHEHPVCDPEDPAGPFMSAGGHWGREGEQHGEHAGDLPPLFVTAEGTATASFVTNRFTVEQLLEGGVAQIVHVDRDNLAHIPDRYESVERGERGPDESTLATGDAGDRAACGIVQRGDGRGAAP